jgi:hypothetical protein
MVSGSSAPPRLCPVARGLADPAKPPGEALNISPRRETLLRSTIPRCGKSAARVLLIAAVGALLAHCCCWCAACATIELVQGHFLDQHCALSDDFEPMMLARKHWSFFAKILVAIDGNDLAYCDHQSQYDGKGSKI